MIFKVLAIYLCIVCISCNGGGGGGSGSPGASETTGFIEESFTGLWAKCENDTSNNSSLLYVYSVSTNSVVSSFVFYGGLNCQTANVAYEEKFVNKVSRIGSTYNSYLVGASSVSLSNGDVTFNNNNVYCGYNNWVLNAPKDILSRNCDGNTNNVGDTASFNLEISGSNLKVTGANDPIELQPISRPDFTHPGTAISNAKYSALNDDVAFLFEFNNGAYTISAYDTVRRIYYSEVGTYSLSQNILTFTRNSETPNCGNSAGETFGLFYSPNSAISVIFKNNQNEIIVAENTSWSESQFRNSFVGSSYTQGCI